VVKQLFEEKNRKINKKQPRGWGGNVGRTWGCRLEGYGTSAGVVGAGPQGKLFGTKGCVQGWKRGVAGLLGVKEGNRWERSQVVAPGAQPENGVGVLPHKEERKEKLPEQNLGERTKAQVEGTH